MRKILMILTCIFGCNACSTTSVLDLPPVFDLPESKVVEQSKTLPDSKCVDIGGVYLKKPAVLVDSGIQNGATNDEKESIYRHVPFDLAEKREIKEGNTISLNTVFLIRQPDEDSFYFSFVTKALGLVEYHFRAGDGDYRCKDGYIEFPLIIYDGMIEAKSVNFQIRNVVLRDESGALIIQQTSGPYRGNPSSAKNKFKYEILRYPPYTGSGE